MAEAQQAVAPVRTPPTAASPETAPDGHTAQVAPTAPVAPVPARPERRRTWLLIAGIAIFAGVLAVYIDDLANHLSALGQMRDLAVYRAGGLITRRASPPGHYDHSVGLYSWHGKYRVSFTYAPIAAIIFAAGSLLSWLALRWVMTIISLAALLLSVWLTFGALGYPSRRVRAGATLLVAAAALVTEPIQQNLALGQINLLLMLLVVVDLTRPRPRWWNGVGIGLAAGIKLVPLIFIPYLLLTGRFRQAAVAVGTFAATIGIGYAVLPGASAQYWWDGLFLNANRITFMGTRGNQSLRGMMTRFIGSVNGAGGAWLAVAITVAVAGLVAAAALYRAGHPVPGMLACALTGLLVSPLSWDHHWVWVAPGLAYLGHQVVRARGRARLAWWPGLAALFAVFAAFPQFWSHQAALIPAGWVWYSPTHYFAYGDNPAYNEFHWNLVQTLAGDAYVFAGLLALGALVAAAVHIGRPLRPALTQTLARARGKVPRLS
ncbi:MAG TPA: glycosyltransferase 87 family protein [Streptosporangiaceae bacterium]|nr:glycosyltransferase 87 family protein [Streptosporangiaceae bacterium]